MNKFYSFITLYLFAIAASGQNNVGIGLNNPAPSAMLDIYSTSKGLLIPRMSSAQRNTIASPLANGLLVFDIDTGCVMVYDSVVTSWFNLCSGSGSGAGGVTGATGANGLPGTTGATGATGPSGTQGNTGLVGPTGAQGTTGPAGATGLQGMTGAQGATGLQGTTGATGTGSSGCTMADYVIKSTGAASACSIIYDDGTAVSVANTSGFGTFDVLQSGGEHVLLGGGANTGSEIKFLNFGTNHFSIYNNGIGELTFAETSAFAQTNTAGTTLMTINSGGLVTASDFSATASGGFLDVMNDLDSIDRIRPIRKLNSKTNKTELVNDASTYPSMVGIKSKNGSYTTDLSNLSCLNTGAIRELRLETKTRDQMLEDRIAELELQVAKLTGQPMGHQKFTSTSVAYKGIQSYFVVDARIKPASVITISGISGYTITNQSDGGFGIKFSQPLDNDMKFTYSAEY